MSRIFFINRFFYPDNSATSQMLSDVAFGLAARGHKVSIITSRMRYTDASAVLPAHEVIRGVDVVRVWTSRFGRQFLPGRALDYLSFYVTAAWAQWRLSCSGDVVVAKTDPPLLSVVSKPVAALSRARSMTWLQDVFPEVATALGLGGKVMGPFFAALRVLRDVSARHSTLIIAIGERMAEHLESLGVPPERIAVIPNWSDCNAIVPVPRERNALRESWQLGDAFVVGYSGNLGRAHEVATLVDAIATLDRAQRDDPALPRVRWLFIGGGGQFDNLRDAVAKRGLCTVRFEAYQPRERLAESLSAADVHLVSLRPELEGLIVPSKFYGVAAAGRATIFIGSHDGEIARVLRAADCGHTIAPGDTKALTGLVLALARDPIGVARMGQNARWLCQTRFDKEIAVASWERILTTAREG